MKITGYQSGNNWLSVPSCEQSNQAGDNVSLSFNFQLLSLYITSNFQSRIIVILGGYKQLISDQSHLICYNEQDIRDLTRYSNLYLTDRQRYENYEWNDSYSYIGYSW